MNESDWYGDAHRVDVLQNFCLLGTEKIFRSVLSTLRVIETMQISKFRVIYP